MIISPLLCLILFYKLHYNLLRLEKYLFELFPTLVEVVKGLGSRARSSSLP